MTEKVSQPSATTVMCAATCMNEWRAQEETVLRYITKGLKESSALTVYVKTDTVL